MRALFELGTLYTPLHFLGIAFGIGGAFAADVFFLSAWKDRVLSAHENRLIRTAGVVTWLGITLLIVSTALLFSLDSGYPLLSSTFLAKMTIVLVIIVNGAIIHTRHLPLLAQIEGVTLTHSALFFEKSKALFRSAAISMVSWLSVLVLGVISVLPYSYGALMGVYLLALISSLSSMAALRRRVLGH